MFNCMKFGINEWQSPVPQFCCGCWLRVEALFEADDDAVATVELAGSVGFALKNKFEAAKATVVFEMVEGAKINRGE